MTTNTKNIDLDTIELAPIADSDCISIYERFAGRVNTKMNAVARAIAPEADGAFQRIMGFITGFGKASPGELPPSDEALRTVQYDDGLRTFIDCSATLRLVLGRDYVTPTITSPRQLRCLCQLALAPSGTGISREELDAQTGTNNSPEYVRILRRKKLNRYGKLIETEKRKVTSNGKKTKRGFYWMTGVGRLIAHDVLAKAGYVHDVFAAERHTRRIEMDRQRLIAKFGNDRHAKAAVLDATKPHSVRLLSLLLWNRGWMSRYDIERLIDAPNTPDVVSNINHGCADQVIEATTRRFVDRDDKECEVGCYRIAPNWVAKMQAAVQDAMVAK